MFKITFKKASEKNITAMLKKYIRILQQNESSQMLSIEIENTIPLLEILIKIIIILSSIEIKMRKIILLVLQVVTKIYCWQIKTSKNNL